MFLPEIHVLTRSRAATTGILRAGAHDFVCAVGRGGVGAGKREGDGKTPAGCHPLRRLFFRPDRMSRPQTGLTTIALRPDFAWCEDAASARYNRLVAWDEASGQDRLWRDDHLYDVIVEIGYNDAPALKGKGSAIFLHLARPAYAPTAGCVALSRQDILHLLPRLGPQTVIRVG